MPAGMQEAVGSALRLLGEPIIRSYRVAPRLSQDLKRKLLYHLTMIAGLELSGFAFVPYRLQRLRSWAAKQYLRASKTLLNIDPSLHSRTSFAVLMEFIRRLGKAPPPDFVKVPCACERVMLRQLRLFELANCNVVNVVNDVVSAVSPVTGHVSEQRVERAINVLKEIYRVRLRQILRSVFTRVWLSIQQRHVGKQQFFDSSKLAESQAAPLGSLTQQLQSILQAVADAGGTPVFPVPLDVHGQDTWDPEETPASEQLDGSQVLGTAGVDMGAYGFAGSFPKQKPQGAIAHSAPYASIAHQPTSPPEAHVYSDPMQYFQLEHPPRRSADYVLYHYNEEADDAHLQAGSSSAAIPAGTAIEGNDWKQLSGTSGHGGGLPEFFPRQKRHEATVDATLANSFVFGEAQQSAPPSSLQIPLDFEQAYPGEYPPEASAAYGVWSLGEEESIDHQQGGPDDESFYLGATAEDGYMVPATETPARELGAQAHPRFVSQQELHDAEGGVVPFRPSAHHEDSTFFFGGASSFKQGFPHGRRFAGPHGFMGGADGEQQSAGYVDMTYGVERADSFEAGRTASAESASTSPNEGGVASGEPLQGEDSKELEDILGLIKAAVDWSVALDEERQSPPQPAPQQESEDVALFSLSDHQATWPSVMQLVPSYMQAVLGETPHVAARAGPQTSTVGADEGPQQSSHGERAHGVGAGGSSYVARAGGTEGKSASKGKGTGVQPVEEDEDSKGADELLKLIQATVDWMITSDTEDGR
ncbi:hypothetical protein Emag_003017 [Eimeria magna]